MKQPEKAWQAVRTGWPGSLSGAPPSEGLSTEAIVSKTQESFVSRDLNASTRHSIETWTRRHRLSPISSMSPRDEREEGQSNWMVLGGHTSWPKFLFNLEKEHR